MLGLERVGAGENFFELGGHSLLATQVASRIREAFGVEVPLPRLFEAPTLAELAGVVRALQRREAGMVPPPLVPAARDRELPLSFAQQRLWFLDQLDPGSSAYNMPLAVRLHGAVEAGLLERIFNEVVRRHEVLRTSFAAAAGEPHQVIAEELEVPLPVVDLERLAAGDREGEAEHLAAAEARRPFDLTAGPLVRFALVRLADDEWVVMATMHHIVSDGWSMGIFLRELATLGGAFSRGESSPLAELPIQYADFAHWQRQWLAGEVIEAQLGYWRERLAGAPPLLELPTDRPRPAVQTFRGRHLGMALSEPLSGALARRSREQGMTLYMTLLAAFKILLSHLTGQEDIVVGSPIAGRNHNEIEELIGFFVNTLVLRTDLSGAPAVRELLVRVRETALGAYAHQDLPFEQLGPYRLGGWSMGGLIAFEMARQLSEQHQRVERLVLIDSVAPAARQWRPEATGDAELALVFAMDLAGIFGVAVPVSSADIEALNTAEEVLSVLHEKMQAARLVPPDLELSQVVRLFETFRINVRALERYSAPVYPDRLVLFKAVERHTSPAEAPDLGWGELAEGGLEIHEVEGNHYSILREPNVEVLADGLREVLDPARAPGRARKVSQPMR